MVYNVKYLLRSALCPQLAGVLTQESGKLGCSVNTGLHLSCALSVLCVLSTADWELSQRGGLSGHLVSYTNVTLKWHFLKTFQKWMSAV